MIKRIHEGHVPITRLRTDLPHGVSAVVDRLLAARPDDRFESASLAAEALQDLMPPAARPDRSARARSGAKKPQAGDDSPPPAEPEAPVDWSRIETALRTPAARTPEAAAPSGPGAPKAPSTNKLSSHRKALEADGVESGKEVHRQYRKEVIQMKRELAELRNADAQAAPPEAEESWLERVGEQLGNFLAEPSAGQIVIAVLLVLLVLALAMGYALA